MADTDSPKLCYLLTCIPTWNMDSDCISRILWTLDVRCDSLICCDMYETGGLKSFILMCTPTDPNPDSRSNYIDISRAFVNEFSCDLDCHALCDDHPFAFLMPPLFIRIFNMHFMAAGDAAVKKKEGDRKTLFRSIFQAKARKSTISLSCKTLGTTGKRKLEDCGTDTGHKDKGGTDTADKEHHHHRLREKIAKKSQ